MGKLLFSARCNIYISCLCHNVSVLLSVSLSVTEVHWRIIANLGFKFRSHFTAHCGRRAASSRAAVLLAVLLAGGSSRAMLASARSLALYSISANADGIASCSSLYRELDVKCDQQTRLPNFDDIWNADVPCPSGPR